MRRVRSKVGNSRGQAKDGGSACRPSINGGSLSAVSGRDGRWDSGRQTSLLLGLATFGWAALNGAQLLTSLARGTVVYVTGLLLALGLATVMQPLPAGPRRRIAILARRARATKSFVPAPGASS